MTRLRTVLCLVLTTALLAGLGPRAVAAQSASELNVTVLVDQTPADLATLFERLRSEIVALVGPQTTVRMRPADLRVSDFDPGRARAHYETAIADDTDVVLAFGPVTGAVLTARDSFPKPTILFGGANPALLDLPDAGDSSGVPNFAFVVSPESYERDLASLRDLAAFERLGIVVPAGPLEGLDLRTRIAAVLAEDGTDYEIVSYTSPADVEAVTSRVDAVYLLESLFIPDEEIEAIAQLLIHDGVASFSGSRREDVELGIMATNQPQGGLDTFLRRIALLVEAVANGEDLAEQPIHLEVSPALTLNLQTARSIGVPLRYSLLGETDFVGPFENPRAERRYALADLVEEILEANPGLEVARGDVLIAEQDRRAARSNYLPDVSADLTQTVLDEQLAAASQGLNPQYTTSGVLSLTQLIFSPQANAGISVQQSLLDAERDGLQAAEWDLVLEASSAYFTALILKANVEIQSRNLDVTKRSLRIAERSFEAGQTGRSDILRLDSEVARATQSLIDAVNALEQAFHAINELTLQPVGREIEVEDIRFVDGVYTDQDFEQIRAILDDPTLREPFEDWLAEEAIANAPELRALDNTVDAVERNIRLSGREWFLPTIAAGLDLNRTFAQEGTGAPPPGLAVDEFFTFGISASIPLFESDQRRITRQISVVQRDQLLAERRSARQAIERALRDVVVDLTGEVAGIQLSAVAEESAREALELAQDAYASGAITVVELLDAQANYLSAQLNQASARYSFLATGVGLQRLVGHFFALRSPEDNAAFRARFERFLQARSQGDPP